MMRQMTALGLAAMLAAASTAVLAGDRDHRGGHHYRGGHHDRHYRGDGYRGGHPAPRYYRGGWARPWYRPYYPYNYSAYLGSALVGSAVAYSLYHSHGGLSCHDDHPERGGSRYEVVGCHRIEILPDGSERRVEVPLSACQ
jgi:hypothetical protein